MKTVTAHLDDWGVPVLYLDGIENDKEYRVETRPSDKAIIIIPVTTEV